MKKTLFYLSMLWLAAAFSYALYERFAEVGLYARLLSWQLETFGSAYISLTTLATVAIYGAPGLIGISLTRPPRGAPHPSAGPRNAAIVLLAFGIVLILVGIGGYLISMAHAARSTATSETTRAPRLGSVDLDSASGVLPPAGADDGVSVTGVLRRDVAYTLEEKGYVGKKVVFCPFVGTGWKPSGPVKMFLRTDPSMPIALYQPGAAGLPQGVKLSPGYLQVDFNAQTPLRVTIEGTLRAKGLPEYAAAAFLKQGIKIADDYVVLEAKPFYDRPAESEWDKFAATSYLLTYFTVPLGVMICLLSLVPFMRWRKSLAKSNQ